MTLSKVMRQPSNHQKFNGAIDVVDPLKIGWKASTKRRRWSLPRHNHHAIFLVSLYILYLEAVLVTMTQYVFASSLANFHGWFLPSQTYNRPSNLYDVYYVKSIIDLLIYRQSFNCTPPARIMRACSFSRHWECGLRLSPSIRMVERNTLVSLFCAHKSAPCLCQLAAKRRSSRSHQMASVVA